MGCSVSQYRFKKRSYWLVVFSIPAHNPRGNAEVTSCDCLLTPQCQIASKLHTHRGLGFAHTSQGTFQSACKEEIWEHLAWHFGAAVLQLKSKPFRTGLGLYCFAWLSLFLSAGTEAAGLAAFVPRWSLESAAKAVLLIRASGLLWQTKAGRGWVCARAVRTSLSQAALRTKQQGAEKLREHFITCESWFNGKLDKLEIGGAVQKVLGAPRAAFPEASWCGAEQANAFQVDVFAVSGKTVPWLFIPMWKTEPSCAYRGDFSKPSASTATQDNQLVTFVD